ncbi:MAG: LacI family transcriptional regulator [Devosiaceae bacterium]|nr:LacI family transcriptional regulator [Devosiaceae bacterium]
MKQQKFNNKNFQRRSVTIKDLSAKLNLSITTISRALNNYPDVGKATRKKIIKTAKELGYRPNRNAQRLVTKRTHNIAWVQSDNDDKFVDPHFVEVMAGVLRGARVGNYDIILSSDTKEQQVNIYDGYVKDNSVDGFIVDLPQENDERINYLLEAGKPFIVHSRNKQSEQYSWVDIDNVGNYRKLTRLLIANGHKKIAFINGDNKFTFAQARQFGVEQALRELDLPMTTVKTYNATHPMANAGFELTKIALNEGDISAILYSSAFMAVEGNAALMQRGIKIGQDIAVASMDDKLNYLDLSQYEGLITFIRSSLRDAGEQLVKSLIEQCENKSDPIQIIIPSKIFLAKNIDASLLDASLLDGLC